MLTKRGVKFVQRVTSPHTDSPCLCDRVFGPVHQMLKGNSFQLVSEVVGILIVGVHGDIDDHLPVSCK